MQKVHENNVCDLGEDTQNFVIVSIIIKLCLYT